MSLLWPTCLQNFLVAFNLINFQNNFLSKKIDSGNYPSIDTYYSNLQYNDDIYLYNVVDVLFFMGIFIMIIPLFVLIRKIVPA